MPRLRYYGIVIGLVGLALALFIAGLVVLFVPLPFSTPRASPTPGEIFEPLPTLVPAATSTFTLTPIVLIPTATTPALPPTTIPIVQTPIMVTLTPQPSPPTPIPPSPPPPTPLPPPTFPPPTPVPPTPTIPPPPPLTGWYGEYFANRDLAGVPAFVRDDFDINFNWGNSPPAPNVPPDNFSVRWSRFLPLPAGPYRFHTLADDGVRVYVDNVLIINDWQNGGLRENIGERNLFGGTHLIRVEYYESVGVAQVAFWWEPITAFPDWRGEYFDNPVLAGAPVVIRNDPAIDFNWGSGSPAQGLPPDNYSVRWTRILGLPTGLYQFTVRMDDGARVWVDEQLLIDAWQDGTLRQITAQRQLNGGQHFIRVEYYEHLGGATIRFTWAQLVPTATPTRTRTPTATTTRT